MQAAPTASIVNAPRRREILGALRMTVVRAYVAVPSASAAPNPVAVANRSAGSFSSAREHRGFDVRRHRCRATRCAARLLGHHARDDRLRARPGERRLAGEHLVQHRAERVDVAARVDRALAHRLLGAHVLRRAEREARLRHALRRRRCCTRERDAEVGDERVPVLQQDVLRLDVAMDDAVPVRVVERVGDLARDARRASSIGQLPLALEPRAQRLARRRTA